MLYVVISVFHAANGRDRTFLHGVFQDYPEALEVAVEVEQDKSYIVEEGYPLSDCDRGVSVYISGIPFGVRVNDFVPTEV
jgi:hypothetical protein